jgi:hypothetical protein
MIGREPPYSVGRPALRLEVRVIEREEEFTATTAHAASRPLVQKQRMQAVGVATAGK